MLVYVLNIYERGLQNRLHEESEKLSGCPRCVFQILEIRLPMNPCGAVRHACDCGPVQFNSRHFVQFRPCVSLCSIYCPTSALRDKVHVIHKLLHVSAPRCHLQEVIDRLACTPLFLQLPDDGISVPKYVGINVCHMYCVTKCVGWMMY
jgi:hypothetical protein